MADRVGRRRHGSSRSLLERRDVHVGVEDLNARRQVDVLRGDLAGTADHQRRLDLGRVGVHPADDALEVEHDVGHVLLDAGDGGELVGHPLDAHARHRGARQGGERHTAQRVPEGNSYPRPRSSGSIRERATVLLYGLACDPGNLEVEHQGPNLVVISPASAGHRLQGVAAASGVDTGKTPYFEYSSMMSCSCTGAATSRRSGLRSTFAVSDS